jgi:hypothetical protein
VGHSGVCLSIAPGPPSRPHITVSDLAGLQKKNLGCCRSGAVADRDGRRLGHGPGAERGVRHTTGPRRLGGERRAWVGINWSGVRTWFPQIESRDRVFATLLFTDIVSSTEMAVRLGVEVVGDDVRGVAVREAARIAAAASPGEILVSDYT